MTLRRRFVALASSAVAVTVIAAAATDYAAIRSELRAQIDSALVERAAPALRLAGGAGPGDPGPLEEGRLGGGDLGPPPRFGEAAGVLQVIAADGRVSVPGGAPALPVSAGARAIAARGSGRAFTDARVAGVHLRMLTVGLGRAGALQVARPLTEVDRVLRRQLILLILVGGAGILAAGALGFLVARTALAPIARFTRRTEALTAQPGASQRLVVEGSDEIARLAQSFNTTLDALERSVEAQRHLVADASHELRSPLASLRANVQVLQDAERLPDHERASLREDVVAEIDELTALVADVVELARGAEPAEELDDVHLDRIVAALVERARRRARDGLRFQTRLEPALVTGEPERIGRAVANVLDNASRWSPPGGVVEVTLQEGELVVRDHGPGFAEADLPHVFERFYRAASARGLPGSGLGLAIVRQAAEAHGGAVRAERALGGGAVIRVRFGPPDGGRAPGHRSAG